MTLVDLWPRFQGHDIISRQITWKWYKIELYLQWPTNRKSHMVYRTAPFSLTLNNPYPRFQGHAIIWRWISQNGTRYRHTFSGILIGTSPYSTVSFRMTSSDIEWLSKIFSDRKRARSLCDSWASCFSCLLTPLLSNCCRADFHRIFTNRRLYGVIH